MKPNNYRVTFFYELDCLDYWKNFKGCRIAYPCVAEVMDTIRNFGIPNVYFFFELHAEITWQMPAGLNFKWPEIQSAIRQILLKYNITDAKFGDPTTGTFTDWFANSDKESRFGERRYARTTELVQEFYDDLKTVEEGKGVNEQVKRCIHSVCNPLGLNYKDEAKICFSRGLICMLFCMFKFNRAVWIYKNVFRQKY